MHICYKKHTKMIQLRYKNQILLKIESLLIYTCMIPTDNTFFAKRSRRPSLKAKTSCFLFFNIQNKYLICRYKRKLNRSIRIPFRHFGSTCCDYFRICEKPHRNFRCNIFFHNLLFKNKLCRCNWKTVRVIVVCIKSAGCKHFLIAEKNYFHLC